MTRWRLAVILLSAGCGRSELAHLPAGDAGTPVSPRVDAGTPIHACSDKVTFDQPSGCVNDGAIEVCARDDAATAAKLARLAPAIVSVGTPGRSCQPPDVAYLWFLFPPRDFCVAPMGAMTDQGWDVVCALAVQPEVSLVSPFWAE
jgi:hypothetical protein